MMTSWIYICVRLIPCLYFPIIVNIQRSNTRSFIVNLYNRVQSMLMWYILLFASVFQRQSQEPVSFSWKEWIKGDRCVVNLAVLVGRLILYRHGSNCHPTFASCHCFLASSVHEKGGFHLHQKIWKL